MSLQDGLLARLRKFHVCDVDPPEPTPKPEPEPVITLTEPEPQPDPEPVCIRTIPKHPCTVIKEAVCVYYNMSLVDLVSERRTRSLVRPRQIGMYLAKKLTVLSFPSIGIRFGNRDHTTVIHACRTIEQLLTTDADIKKAVEELTTQLTARLEPVT